MQAGRQISTWIYKKIHDAIMIDADAKYVCIDNGATLSVYMYPENLAILKDNGMSVLQLFWNSQSHGIVRRHFIIWDGSEELVHDWIKHLNLDTYDIKSLC